MHNRKILLLALLLPVSASAASDIGLTSNFDIDGCTFQKGGKIAILKRGSSEERGTKVLYTAPEGHVSGSNCRSREYTIPASVLKVIQEEVTRDPQDDEEEEKPAVETEAPAATSDSQEETISRGSQLMILD